jgi:hypothetical protein
MQFSKQKEDMKIRKEEGNMQRFTHDVIFQETPSPPWQSNIKSKPNVGKMVAMS